MVFYQLLSIVKLKLNGFPTSTNCDHLNLQLSSANYKQLKVQRPYPLCKTVKYQCRNILIYLYCNYQHYSYLYSNTLHYSNIFEQFLYLRIVFGIRIRFKLQNEYYSVFVFVPKSLFVPTLVQNYDQMRRFIKIIFTGEIVSKF